MKIKKKVEGDGKKQRDTDRVSTETMMDKLYYSHLSELLFECGTNGKDGKTNSMSTKNDSEKKKNNNKTYINKLNKK
ncbi:MAG: hypothetical protein IAE90_01680 [Ignavibacteria bacterium]|nr:hypothetical protein [Ignavibacteria bacterium]